MALEDRVAALEAIILNSKNKAELTVATSITDIDGIYFFNSATQQTEIITKQKLLQDISGTDANYVHNQGSALAVWSVTHNLGKNPSVTILDTANNEIEGDVLHVDNNNTTITFASSTAGKAIFN